VVDLLLFGFAGGVISPSVPPPPTCSSRGRTGKEGEIGRGAVGKRQEARRSWGVMGEAGQDKGERGGGRGEEGEGDWGGNRGAEEEGGGKTGRAEGGGLGETHWWVLALSLSNLWGSGFSLSVPPREEVAEKGEGEISLSFFFFFFVFLCIWGWDWAGRVKEEEGWTGGETTNWGERGGVG